MLGYKHPETACHAVYRAPGKISKDIQQVGDWATCVTQACVRVPFCFLISTFKQILGSFLFKSDPTMFRDCSSKLGWGIRQKKQNKNKKGNEMQDCVKSMGIWVFCVLVYKLHVYMYICVYIYLDVHIYINSYISIHMYTHKHVAWSFEILDLGN